ESSQHRHRHQEAGRVAQRAAGAEDQASYRTGGDREGGGDLLVASALELALHERLTLSGREPLEPVDDARHLLTLAGDVGRLRNPVEAIVEVVVRRLVAEVVEGAVADDRVEPWPKPDSGVAAANRPERADERLLDYVLGAMGR